MPIDLRGKITKIKTIYSNYLTISSTKLLLRYPLFIASFPLLILLPFVRVESEWIPIRRRACKGFSDKNRALLQHSLTINRVYNFLPIAERKRTSYARREEICQIMLFRVPGGLMLQHWWWNTAFSRLIWWDESYACRGGVAARLSRGYWVWSYGSGVWCMGIGFDAPGVKVSCGIDPGNRICRWHDVVFCNGIFTIHL